MLLQHILLHAIPFRTCEGHFREYIVKILIEIIERITRCLQCLRQLILLSCNHVRLMLGLFIPTGLKALSHGLKALIFFYAWRRANQVQFVICTHYRVIMPTSIKR